MAQVFAPKKTFSTNTITGFTLVELIIVIVLLAILSMYAAPLFVGKEGFEEQSIRDQLISELRLIQLFSMNNTADSSDCDITIAAKSATSDCSVVSGDIDISDSDSSFSPAQTISFDSMGVPSCSASCQISVTGEALTVNVCIESQGYIREC